MRNDSSDLLSRSFGRGLYMRSDVVLMHVCRIYSRLVELCIGTFFRQPLGTMFRIRAHPKLDEIFQTYGFIIIKHPKKCIIYDPCATLCFALNREVDHVFNLKNPKPLSNIRSQRYQYIRYIRQAFAQYMHIARCSEI